MEPLLSRTKLGNSFNGSPQPEILQDFHETKPTTSEMGRKVEPIWIHDQTSSRNEIRKTRCSKPTSGVRRGRGGSGNNSRPNPETRTIYLGSYSNTSIPDKMIEPKRKATHSGNRPISRSRHNGKRGTHHSTKTTKTSTNWHSNFDTQQYLRQDSPTKWPGGQIRNRHRRGSN